MPRVRRGGRVKYASDASLLDCVLWLAFVFFLAALLAAIAIGLRLVLAYHAEMRIEHKDR